MDKTVGKTNENASKTDEPAKKERTASIREIFLFATPLDIVACITTSVLISVFGATQVAFVFLIEDFIGGVADSQAAGGGFDMTTVNQMVYMFCVLAGIIFCVCFPAFAIGNVSAASQKRAWEKAMIKAILRQDVGWFDCNNPERLPSTVGSSIQLVYKALEGQSYMMFMGVGGVSVGLIGGFLKSWKVALVVLACFPVLIAAVGLIAYALITGTKKKRNAFSAAGGVATEALFAMRTVSSLGTEAIFRDRFSSSLGLAKVVDIKTRSMLGFAAGVLFSAILLLQAAGFMFGGIIFAAEMDASSYEYSVSASYPNCEPDPINPLAPPICSTTTVNFNYCAHANNTPGDVSIDAPCQAPMQPLRMNCHLANLLQTFDNNGTGAFGTNMSMLQVIQQDTWDSFRSYSQQQAPPTYVETNPAYWGCSLDGATIIIACMLVMQGCLSLGQAAQPIGNWTAALSAAGALVKIVQRVSPIDSFADDGATLPDVRGDIEVRDVVFAYPSAPEHLVCKGYNLSIQAGQTVALSGPSGSGKSTIIALIERFYDPLDGMLTLDGVDIKTLNVRWLRSQLGLVSQEPVLFQGTVAENIEYGKEGATQEEIEAAAKMANAHEFITTALSDGYKTEVGQGGSKLSGGQKQRVAIARAIIKKPAVLLLDEATSALDNTSEKIVQAALDEIMTKQRRTTIVIAHRLSTIRNADKIAVVTKGEVVEQGTYDELLAIGEEGHFYALAKKQEEMGAKDLAIMQARQAAPTPAPEAVVVEAVPVPEPSPSKRAKRNSKEGKSRNSKEGAEEGKPAAVPDGTLAKPAGNPKVKVPLGRLYNMQKESHGYLLLGTVLALGSGGLPLYGFYCMVNLFGVFFQTSPTLMLNDTLHYCGLIFASMAGVIFCCWADTTCFGIAAARLTHKLRQQGFVAFVGQDMAFFDQEEHNAGDLTAFLAEKVTLVEFLTGGQLQALVRAGATVVTIIVFSFLFGSWQLSLYVMCAFPIMGTIMGAMAFAVTGDEIRAKQGKQPTGRRAQEEKAAGALIGEVVLAIRTVASFNAEHRFVRMYNEKVDRRKILDLRAGIATGLTMGIGMSLFMLVMAGLNYYGGYLISVGACDFEEMMTPMFMMMGGMTVLMGAALGAKDVPTASKAAKLFFEATDVVPKINVFAEGGATLPDVRGDIEVRDVVFAYPSAPEHLVCKGYNLSIQAGQTVALSGPSGSGKSTIIALIERFYDPLDGMLTLDGVDIKTLNVRWLRSQLGLVSQEPVLFQGTVAENIRYGRQDATQEDIEEAGRMANAHEFIMSSLGNGYDTDVGIRGSKLSGGQKQRVAIARALVRKPAVLLLDEATSALDNESERVVQAALDEIMTKLKRTTIVIAHRLSTIRTADKIAVLKEGAVVEEGTHDELLANPQGLYFNLVLAQSSH